METERLLLLLQFWNNFTHKKEGMEIWREASYMERGVAGGRWGGGEEEERRKQRSTYITEMNRKGMNT
jgi:hypothetical protein